MNMKKLVSSVAAFALTASAFAGLAVNASAAPGDVSTIYSEDFETAANYNATNVYSHTVFKIAGAGTGTNLTTKTLQIGSDRSGSSCGVGFKKSLTDNTEEANALSTYKNAVIDFDFEALQVRADKDATTHFGFGDSDGNLLFGLNVGTGKNLGTNELKDASGKATTLNGTAFHFTIDLDFIEKTQKITVKDSTGAKIGDIIEASNITQKDFDGFYYPNTIWSYGYSLIDNLTITTKEIAAATADYTVNYKCGDTVIKTDNGNDVVGVAPSITMTDFEKDGKKYACASNDLGEKTVLADGSLVVTVTCTEIPAVSKATVNYVAGEATVASEVVDLAEGSFEGENYKVPYRRYVVKDGVLYESGKTDKEFGATIPLVTETVLTVPVTAVTVAEGETFVAVADGDGDNGNNAGVRASNGSATRGTLTIADVQPGIYKIVFNGYLRKTGDGPELFLGETSLGVLTETCKDAWTTDYTQKDIKVTSAGTLAIRNCDMMDTVVLYKTGDVEPAPVEKTLPEVTVTEGKLYNEEGSLPAKVFTGKFTVGENNYSVKAVDWTVTAGGKTGTKTSTFGEGTVITGIEVVTGLVVEYADAANLSAENVTAIAVAADASAAQ